MGLLKQERQFGRDCEAPYQEPLSQSLGKLGHAKPNDTENHNSAWTETSTSAFDDSYSSHSSPPPVREPSPVEERSWSQEASDGADRFHDYLHGDDYGSTGFYGSGTFD
uniref:Uncharacterized protein n=1 Tax=Fusarium oxysporum (strain Fo5176) TaxID=660025 RepID=A0A0D2YF26_FUSOF